MKSWAIYIAAALGFVIYGAVTDVDRDSSGAIVGGGTVDAFQVQVGDYFDDAVVHVKAGSKTIARSFAPSTTWKPIS